MSQSITLRARTGIALPLKAGQSIRITNTYGQQVVDTWALCAGETHEVMSMEHTRSCLDKIAPAVGDRLFTNRRRPILEFIEDTSPGVHDTLLSACDEARYRLLGFEGNHGSCAENFRSALDALGIPAPALPSPWNLFENVRVDARGTLAISPPVSRAGDYVVIRALMDAVVIFSACPMDIALTNGLDRLPKDVELALD